MNDIKLTKSERETTIYFTEADGYATIETYNRRLIKRLEGLCKKHSGFTVLQSEDGFGVYQVPKKYVWVQKPRKKSDYHKNVAGLFGAIALKKYRESRQKAKNQ